jgi:4-alpha-glucanotransferase
MQDWLALDGTARMNTPGKGSGQWRWRMLPDALGALDPATIRNLIDATARA